MYITEMINNDYKTWKNGERIIITSPTGSGKTFFIINTLLKYARSQNETCLYLCNRSALCHQIQKYVGENSENFRILTYQKAEHNMHLLNEGYKYIIFDEAHYFFSDSNFNHKTSCWFSVLRNTSGPLSCVKIFITATPYDLRMVFNPIDMRTYDSYYRKNPDSRFAFGDEYCEQLENIPVNGLRKYSLQANYDSVDCRYFRDYTELESAICNSNKKWLIFINKIDVGKDLCDRLNRVLRCRNKRAVFLYSGTKSKCALDEFENLKRGERFDCHVLISTNVIDNGISIKDKDLENIVISNYDKSTFIQMLGRRRLEDGDSVKLYIKKIPPKTFLGLVRKCERCISYMLSYYRANIIEYHDTPHNGTWHQKNKRDVYKIKKNLFHLAKKNFPKGLLDFNDKEIRDVKEPIFDEFKVNYFAFMKNIYQLHCYKSISEQVEKDELAFLKLQLSWLIKTCLMS